MRTTRLLAPSAMAIVLLGTACSGLFPQGGGGCDPPFLPGAFPSGLAVETSGRYAFVAASWWSIQDPCSPGHFGGALSVADLKTGSSMTFDGLPSLTGRAVYAGGRFLAIPGGSWGSLTEYYLVPASPPFALTTKSLAAAPTDIVSDGRDAYLALPASSVVLVYTSSGSEVTIPTISGVQRLTLAWGKLYASNGSAVAEIDPASRSQLRTFPSCPGPGLLAPVGSHTLAAVCNTGVDLIDVTSLSATVLATSEAFSFATGSTAWNRALVSASGGSSAYSRILAVGSGEVGTEVPGALIDPAVFVSGTSAFAVLAGYPARIDLDSGAFAIVSGNIGGSDYAQISGLGSSGLLTAIGLRPYYQLRLVRVDPTRTMYTGTALSVAPASQLPFQY